MRGSLAFHWFRLQYRFAEALASRDRVDATDDHSLWVCYRLGLYQTVADCRVTPGGWRARLALAASFAAVGAADEAAVHVRKLIAEGLPARCMTAVARGLAPFAPDLALLASECRGVPVCLHAGLLLRMAHVGAAADLIRVARGAAGPRQPPELELLCGNVLANEVSQRLGHLNAFLSRFSLPAVALTDASLPPGPLNLQSPGVLSAVRGPLVSILMTTFRSAGRVGAALRSLLAQTYRDIEVIVVDDASDDDTWAVVQAIAAGDARVRCFRLPCNVGTYVAKHVGFLRAKGEFVTCHDSDDWAHPLRIELQVRPLLRSRHLVCTTSEWVRMQDDGMCYARQVYPLQRLNPASPLFRKELVRERAGLWDVVRTGADSEFLARLKLVFGRGAVKRLALPLTLGSHRSDSLMTAASTGHTPHRVSPARLAYWESWTRWHIAELCCGFRPRLPLDFSVARCFPAPAALRVSAGDLGACLASPHSGLDRCDCSI